MVALASQAKWNAFIAANKSSAVNVKRSDDQLKKSDKKIKK